LISIFLVIVHLDWCLHEGSCRALWRSRSTT